MWEVTCWALLMAVCGWNREAMEGGS